MHLIAGILRHLPSSSRAGFVVLTVCSMAVADITTAAGVESQNDSRSDADVWSTAEATGVSDPLAFLLSAHFPDLSMYPEFDIAMGAADRCLLVSPLPCD